MDTNLLFEIVNLGKKYGKNQIFKNLNLKVYKDDRIALIGPNGVGKTTLVEMICGLRKINQGKINFFNNKKRFLKHFGMQFQIGTYPEGIKVKDMIYLYSNVYQQKINLELKKTFKINELENKAINSLSFGEQKRIELFLLLAAKLKFLILDEITSGMDISIKLVILKILQKYIKEHRVQLIYISHNLNEINQICNRLIVITKNGIVLDRKLDGSFDVQKTISDLLIDTKLNNEK